jgi:hypothetical protein
MLRHEMSRYQKEPEGDRIEQISMSQVGDTTIYYYNNNIIYYSVGDSVLINFIDSVRFKQLVDESGLKERPMSY